MTEISFVDRVVQDPAAARATYASVEAALQDVLPGSRYHTRYADVGNVGLAVVVARDGVAPDTYNPLYPGAIDRVSFAADNQAEHPKAWTPLPVDVEQLGGVPAKGVGRFTAYALAKVTNLAQEPDLRNSHNVLGIQIAPGLVGFAGGQRTPDTLSAASGLWEVYDAAVISLFEDELARGGDRSAGDIADRLIDIFREIREKHQGLEASMLPRRTISWITWDVPEIVAATR